MIRPVPVLWSGGLQMLKPLIFVLALGGSMFPGTTASAQSDHGAAHGAPRIPVLLAVVDTLQDTKSRFRIVRLAGESARHVVLLPENATPELLTEAVETLRLVWTRAGGSSDAPTGMYRRAPGQTETRSPRVLSWGERVINDLRHAPERHVPGVGHVRAVQIWLAPLPATASRNQGE
jgi:hypothetical protein